jgi:hypothetical protein
VLKTVLIIALVAALSVLGWLNLPRLGGRYWLRDSDHAEAMTSGTTPATTRRIGILFVGNSFTFTNDLPAMLVNLAAADEGDPTALTVKAFTYPDAKLSYLLQHSDALSWAGAHHMDFAVLQEHSGWYGVPRWVEDAHDGAAIWQGALAPLHIRPVLFESWADEDGSEIYTNPTFYAFGRTRADLATDSEVKTAELAQAFGMPMVLVGRAFEHAARLEGVPELFRADHHHPSIAGTYLAALVFYRFFTGRSGAESDYRPWGMSADEAALLVKAAGE